MFCTADFVNLCKTEKSISVIDSWVSEKKYLGDAVPHQKKKYDNCQSCIHVTEARFEFCYNMYQ